MNTYTHTLTPLESACGVTLEDVARELPRGAFIDEDRAFAIDGKVGPALAMSTARAAFRGAEIRFAGLNTFGHAVYRRATRDEAPRFVARLDEDVIGIYETAEAAWWALYHARIADELNRPCELCNGTMSHGPMGDCDDDTEAARELGQRARAGVTGMVVTNHGDFIVAAREATR